MFLYLGKAGASREATLVNAVSGAESLGLSRGPAAAIADDLSSMVAKNWRRVLSERGMSQQELDMVASSFSEAGLRANTNDP